MLTETIWLPAALSAAAVALYLLAGFRLQFILRRLSGFALLAALLSLFCLFAAGKAPAAGAGLQLFALLSLAAFVNATTQSSALTASLERGLALLAPLGLNPRKTALALALTLRFLPLIRQCGQDSRTAMRVRGGAERLTLRAQTRLIGLSLLRLVQMHEEITEAIEARGFDAEA